MNANDPSHAPTIVSEAGTPPPMFSVGDELALRAGVDAAWDPVLAVYLAGLEQWPHPFTPRPPTT